MLLAQSVPDFVVKKHDLSQVSTTTTVYIFDMSRDLILGNVRQTPCSVLTKKCTTRAWLFFFHVVVVVFVVDDDDVVVVVVVVVLLMLLLPFFCQSMLFENRSPITSLTRESTYLPRITSSVSHFGALGYYLAP